MDDPLLTVRDYIVSSTYRKHEQKGANWGAWRTMGIVGDKPSKPVVKPVYGLQSMYAARSSHCRERRPLRAARVEALTLAAPAPTPSLASILDGTAAFPAATAAQKLSTILHLAGLPLRWEPLNSSPQHRGIPSPSSLFPTALYVAGRVGDAGARSFALLPQQRLLCAAANGPAVDDLLADADLAFVVIGRLGDAVTPYGEFAPCLLALEGGGLQAQITLLGAAVGWRCEAIAGIGAGAVRRALGLDEWSDWPLAIIRVRGDDAGAALSAAATEWHDIAEYVPLAQDVEAYPRIRSLVEALALDDAAARSLETRVAAARRGASPAGRPRTDEQTVAEVVGRRTAGNGDGLAPLGDRLTAAMLEDLARDAAALFFLEASDLTAVDLAVTLSVLHGEGALDGGYDMRIEDGGLTRWGKEDGRDPLRARVSQAARDRSLVVTLSVDDSAELRRWGPQAFLLSHVAAGSLGQCFCLAAAARGMSARPIRAFTDFIIDTALPLERRAIYQIVCCFERRANPAYDLL